MKNCLNILPPPRMVVFSKHTKPPNNEELSKYLASSTYGCIFQAYYLGSTLQHCFKYNGTDDAQKWFGALASNGYDWLRQDISKIDNEYFNTLKERNELEELMNLVPDNYLIEEGDNKYTVNIEKLKEDTSMFIEKHNSLLKQLIEKYDKKFAADEL